MRIVGKKDVVQTLGLVTRNAWEVAVRGGHLKPLLPKFRCRRTRYLAEHVEEVFGLPKGCVRDA